MVKKQKAMLLLINLLLCNLYASEPVQKRVLEDYCFVLMMQNDQINSNYLCAIFALTDLRVCRFPGGPLWSNSLANQELYVISQEVYSQIKNLAQKMAILCLDYTAFKRQCHNDCHKNICGFALPWDLGMAYVFDDLQDVAQVSGLIIEKNKLLDFKLGACLKKIDLNQRDLMVIDVAQIDHTINLNTSEPDDIDLLLENQVDTEEEVVLKPMSYPMQKITNFVGKIVISCLMGYLDLKQKVIKIMRNIYARQKA